MVREPAVQIINCIKQSDLNDPAIRYVLYGRPGCGKSITLAHLTHYGHSEGYITMTFSQVCIFCIIKQLVTLMTCR